jgi:hypothetical protein
MVIPTQYSFHYIIIVIASAIIVSTKRKTFNRLELIKLASCATSPHVELMEGKLFAAAAACEEDFIHSSAFDLSSESNRFA